MYDATWQDPYKSAEIIKFYLMGLYKPIYHPLNESGDHVVVINSKEIALRGDEWRKRVYFHHTTYHGGASWTLAWELHNKDPTLIVKKAVYGALPKNLQRRHIMQRLHIFPNNKVPDDILKNITSQIRQLRDVPVRLDHIPQEEVDNFPQLLTYPKNYILK
ncbi:39S ribosomal protein L13, mitochondrial [Ooceraea biroi]|uniref:39S ribosomal protein L13, mitochondrial n=2 Tax=Ooceraea biroi TaxID=2015173 RepID=A0A026WNY9_OOCBI|nr:39S ribosomal protein L13, mitochondrial [Ooceraea biroi]